MVALKEYYPKLTPDEYFAWEEQQECRYEYVNNEVYAMTGGTVNHGQIAVNLSTILRNHLEDGGCRVLSSDVKLQIEDSSNYVYPDISVTCDERDRPKNQFISYPCIIVEILSPSTEAYDRGNKFNNLYRRSTTLQEYVLVSSGDVAIDLYRKNEKGGWEIISHQVGDLVELQSIGLTFSIDKVFNMQTGIPPS